VAHTPSRSNHDNTDGAVIMAITTLPFLCLCAMPVAAWAILLAAVVLIGED